MRQSIAKHLLGEAGGIRNGFATRQILTKILKISKFKNNKNLTKNSEKNPENLKNPEKI